MPNIAQDTWHLLPQAPAFTKAERGRAPGHAEGTGRLPGNCRQADLVTKVARAPAAHHLRRARPRPSRVKQPRDASPHMPVRELGGIRPPVRSLLVKARLPCCGFGLHRSPLADLGAGVSSAGRAAESQLNDMLPAGRPEVNGQIAPRWWLMCALRINEPPEAVNRAGAPDGLPRRAHLWRPPDGADRAAAVSPWRRRVPPRAGSRGRSRTPAAR